MATIPVRLYTGPAVPTVYDPKWQGYTNLTDAQKAWFQSQPQWLTRYLRVRRWHAEISGTTVGGIPLNTQDRDQSKIGQLKQAFDNGSITGSVSFFDAAGNVQSVNSTAATALYQGVLAFVQQTYTTAANIQAGVTAGTPTITSMAQIDKAYATIAPNSISAKLIASAATSQPPPPVTQTPAPTG